MAESRYARCLCGRLPGPACRGKGCRTALTDALDRTVHALEDVLEHKSCADPDCCEASIEAEAARVRARETLDELGVEPSLTTPIGDP